MLKAFQIKIPFSGIATIESCKGSLKNGSNVEENMNSNQGFHKGMLTSMLQVDLVNDSRGQTFLV